MEFQWRKIAALHEELATVRRREMIFLKGLEEYVPDGNEEQDANAKLIEDKMKAFTAEIESLETEIAKLSGQDPNETLHQKPEV